MEACGNNLTPPPPPPTKSAGVKKFYLTNT